MEEQDSNYERILGDFLHLKDLIDPLTEKPISKEKRIEELNVIVLNRHYEKVYTKEERLFANELIKSILEED